MLTIGQVAARSGFAPSALRFYEDRGLIRSRRTDAGHRRYPADTLRRLAFVRVAQRVGVDLAEIAEALAELPSERTPTKRDWERLSRRWAPRLDQRIAVLQRLRTQLSACIGCGCLSLQSCALSNPDDMAGDLGSGPRWLLGDPPPTHRGS